MHVPVARLLLTSLVLLGAPTFVTADRPIGPSSFDQVIAPLLANRCLNCHEGPQAKGKLDLSRKDKVLAGGRSGPALVAGKPEDSLLWQLIDKNKMPPKHPLPAGERALIKAWIASGASWGTDPIDVFRFTTASRAGYDWWSLQMVKSPAPPAVKMNSWVINPIDRFILAKLEAKELAPSAAADRRTLIRRLSLDLTGLVPTPAEVDAFVNDASANACERLVDRLLASPHHGERWARHWLDVVRFGESHGFEHDELRGNAWPYRDWVINSLNRDMPYDEFARQQLAGDVLHPDDPGGTIATGFLVAGAYDSVGQKQQSVVMRTVVRQDELEDMLGTVGQTFLGLTVHCARCHDHKFDPVRLTDYYRLTAALAGVRHGERDVTPPAERQALAQELKSTQSRLSAVTKELAASDKRVRDRLLAERRQGKSPVDVPPPIAGWDFEKGLGDVIGKLDARLHGDARRGPEGLLLTGKTGYAATPPLPWSLKARTMVARLALADLEQRGGAAISLQTLDGGIFDAIVYGEQQPGRWLAGSNFFERSRAFDGPAESQKQPVVFAIVYAEDGTITAYRNGQVYGKPYRVTGPVHFAAGKAQIVFGLRHTPVGSGKLLAGTIHRAMLFDLALSATQVAALAGVDLIGDDEIVARLSSAERDRRKRLLDEARRLKVRLTPRAQKLAYAVTPSPPEAAHLLLRGSPTQKGPLVAAGAIASIARVNADFGLATDAPEGPRRAKLAAWLSDARNPLFARVIVNRLWHHHFGVGLVDTPNDFGFNGGRPSHPELLDWLAAELVRRGWSLKEMHRLIVSSATYRQASRFRGAAARLDAGNRLLWRKGPMRLEAEAVRDAILRVSGKLNLAMGGPGYQDFKLFIRGATHYYNAIDEDRPDLHRRTVYRTWARSGRSRLLDTLDCPDPSTVTPARAVTTTPLQALALLNNAFVLRMAEHFAARVKNEGGDDVDGQVRYAYDLAYNRAPATDELTVAREVVRRHGLIVLCRAIFNSNEFMYVD